MLTIKQNLMVVAAMALGSLLFMAGLNRVWPSDQALQVSSCSVKVSITRANEIGWVLRAYRRFPFWIVGGRARSRYFI